MLAQLRSATFGVQDAAALSTLKGTLLDALTTLERNIKQEDSLRLEEPKHSASQPQLCDLPPPLKKKYAGRVGEGTSTNRQLTGVKTGIDKIGTAITKTVPVHTIPYESGKFVESPICMST